MEEIRIELVNYLPRLIKGIRDMAQDFHSNDYKKGFDLLSQVIEGIEWVSTAYSATAGDKSGYIADLNKSLTQVNDSINNEDYVLAADIFEYEVIEILEGIFNEVSTMKYN